jgi:hypothetical protein
VYLTNSLGLHIDQLDFRSGISHLPDGGVAAAIGAKETLRDHEPDRLNRRKTDFKLDHGTLGSKPSPILRDTSADLS